ncbi:hypothetical protein HG535_0A00980 [Zygotorulaspora mrakii]|uniref:Amino acid transporter transmembrane domain-containing protein n=1 Tax=Zygotorulaspora mrakii TaxID=42260 RepID=A0A7H9AWK6_ZYGMR|nr:uncharacterized protein HG535_0A00980 [Zygotorulaspora mrakii]QLG70159.1 hypothetical protein HG535_0A00980 [Zygotorulaspora mrakii]
MAPKDYAALDDEGDDGDGKDDMNIPDVQFEMSNFTNKTKLIEDSIENGVFDLDNTIGIPDYDVNVVLSEDPLVRDVLRENENKSTMRWAFMNMANSILGAGVISQPFALKNCGIIGGLVAYFLLGFLVDWTLRLIAINLVLTGTQTYQDTIQSVMGRKGKILILVTNGLFAFGGCIGFCIIIGDTVPHVLRSLFHSNSFFLRRNVIISLVTFFISYPLSLQRNIAALSKASFLALVSMVVIVFSVIIRGPMLNSALKSEGLSIENIFVTPRFFRGVSVISFALVCHHNTSFIFLSMKNRSIQKFSKLTHISSVVSVIFCMLMGYSGFGVFGMKTKGNILNNFPVNDKTINIARLCFGFNMLTTFPLEIFVLRDVISTCFQKQISTNCEPAILSTKLHFIITTVLVFGTMSVSLTTCNLGALFELIGATTASIMAYILPPLTNLLLRREKSSFKSKSPHILSIIFGATMMIVSSAQTIFEAIHGEDQNHCEI